MESETLRLMRTREANLDEEIAALRAQLAPLVREREQVRLAIRVLKGDLIPPTGAEASEQSVAHHRRMAHPDVQRFTFKELILKALSERFSSGATANELLDFFKREWGREIMRTSLSPQLSRLRAEGQIELFGKVWCLVEHANPPPETLANIEDQTEGERLL